ncbi:helix-turn-helix transcriptional regulator [Vibrio algivorus]|uniref:Helix-turn-helix transcriptional regulator n=1 Tax=Vibrio algivorus TaxID=1667024 RepID=A0A557P9Q1_9VIBR|nr:helix-turn-helix transcriptional regulator [Vibrio algivorus]TVO37372.1 helix-turn-helix transcriptional regulator [Vibrio algivorus]
MNNIAVYRNKINVSQERLSKELGCSSSAIGNYEQGTRGLTLEMSRSIVRALNSLGSKCTLDDVFPDPDDNIIESKDVA